MEHLTPKEPQDQYRLPHIQPADPTLSLDHDPAPPMALSIEGRDDTGDYPIYERDTAPQPEPTAPIPTTLPTVPSSLAPIELPATPAPAEPVSDGTEDLHDQTARSNWEDRQGFLGAVARDVRERYVSSLAEGAESGAAHENTTDGTQSRPVQSTEVDQAGQTAADQRHEAAVREALADVPEASQSGEVPEQTEVAQPPETTPGPTETGHIPGDHIAVAEVVYEPEPLQPPRPHEAIAADQYWEGPAAPQPDKIPFRNRVADVWLGKAIMNAIDDVYFELAERGAVVARSLPEGEELAIDDPEALLKVVQDMRIHTPKPTVERHFDTPEVFDEQAQAMVDELLFTGRQTGVMTEGPDGDATVVARRAVYLRNSPTLTQLAGKTGDMLGRGGDQYGVVFMRRRPVGSITQSQNRGEHIQTRVVSAELIVPSGPKMARAKIFDLGSLANRFVPNPLPTTA